jgi:tetratricopeptide (TPR) repeat protein
MRTKFSLLLAAVALLLINPPSALAQEQEAASEQPTVADEPAANESFERGLRLYRNRDFRQALEEFNRVIDVQPDRGDAHYLIGYAHLMLKEFQASLDAFRRAFEENPNLDPRTIYQK